MDLRSRTALFCAALAFAIATSVLLRARVRQLQVLFAAFAADVGLWYLTQALFGIVHGPSRPLLVRASEILAVLMPQLAVRLFSAIVPAPSPLLPSGETATAVAPRPRLHRRATLAALPVLALVLSPYHEHDAVRVLLFVYTAGLTSVALWHLAAEGRASGSRAVRARTRFLAAVGALAALFTLADFLSLLGARLPPVGAVLSIVFLFVLSQSLQSARLLDLYDLAGRLLVATALAFAIAGIFWLFVSWVGAFNTMYLNAVLASIAILVLFNPLQAKVEEYTHQIFFRERFDLESAVSTLRKRLAHVLELREMSAIVVAGLEQSRRITSAALYLREGGAAQPGGAAFVLDAHLGEAPAVARVEEGSSRTLLDRLAQKHVAVREEVERELSDALDAGDAHAVAQARELYMRLDGIGAGAAFAIEGDDKELVGIFVVHDDRVRDAFSPEELALFEGLAGQLSTVVENSRAYARVKERDRLAALGAMAAGLAHEVKNPLGAIKGAAQLLAEEAQDAGDGREARDGDAEFVGIILEEVDRLDRVVSSILDYARPRPTEVPPIDVNAAVRRTMQILAPAHGAELDLKVELEDELPSVRIDPEQLRQVLMNLVTNAVQAMGGSGRLAVSTDYRRRVRGAAIAAEHGVVEIRVADTGPGISAKVLKNLFVPFFTTKTTGTGLGLAISQRIAQSAGGTIDVQTSAGVGTTFTVMLPAHVARPMEEPASPESSPRSSSRTSAPPVSKSRPPS
jgi:signal transduction histidine kinase